MLWKFPIFWNEALFDLLPQLLKFLHFLINKQDPILKNFLYFNQEKKVVIFQGMDFYGLKPQKQRLW